MAQDCKIKWALRWLLKQNILLSLVDTRLAFYNTAPSPSGPSGIHCDLKPDTDNTTRVTENGFCFPPFTSCPHLQFYFLMISIDSKFKICPYRKEAISHREPSLNSLQTTLIHCSIKIAWLRFQKQFFSLPQSHIS